MGRRPAGIKFDIRPLGFKGNICKKGGGGME